MEKNCKRCIDESPIVFLFTWQGNSTGNGGADNHLCANNIRILQGGVKNFFCKPTAYGRYVYVRIPGNDKYVMICEVEVYSKQYLSSKCLCSCLETYRLLNADCVCVVLCKGK